MSRPSTPEAVFRQNSRSFSLAARLFPRDKRHAIARLYAFCRYLDNLADDSPDGEGRQLQRAGEMLRGKRTAPAASPEADFIELSREFGLPHQPALDLIEALLADCGSRRTKTADELVRFAYGVAGTVGLLMCPIIETGHEEAAPFAVDLGIALQLTNIARDIAEDAARDRFYLPASWATAGQVKAALRGDPAAGQAVEQAVRRLLAMADDYYQSARTGMIYIPARNRKVIFFAASLYEAIGLKLLRLPPGAWRQRTILKPTEKIRTILRACLDYRKWMRKEWQAEPKPQHQDRLHAPLHFDEPSRTQELVT